MKTHTLANNSTKRHECPECGKPFRYPKDVQRHFDTKHSDDRPYECPVPGCRVSPFKRPDHLKRHLSNQHNMAMSDYAVSEQDATFSIAYVLLERHAIVFR